MKLVCEKGWRKAAVLCAVAALCACTRTYDGTIVPEYTAEVVARSPVPVYRFRKTDTEPPSRMITFPPAPPAVEQIAGEPVPPKRRYRSVPRKVQPVAKERPAPAKKVTCRRDNSDAGRIRVICD